MPAPLVYLRDLDPTIRQDIRYATNVNFTGRVVAGYEAAECVLLPTVAAALARVQADLAPLGLSLLVYDCYRPRRAAAAFWAWSQSEHELAAAKPFHPRLAKARLHALGYIARTSTHSMATTVDLTIMPLSAAVRSVGALEPCHADPAVRDDGSLDMGTGFDCLDPMSHARTTGLGPAQQEARRALAVAMTKHGFTGYFREWWHFTHRTQEGGGRSFDVPIKPRPW